jgi:hypothetical protein
MARYTLKGNDRVLQVGWSAKLVAEFEPVADCHEESFWVRVETASQHNGSMKYRGIVEDYLTYTQSHGLTMGFSIEFSQEHVSEVRVRAGQEAAE